MNRSNDTIKKLYDKISLFRTSNEVANNVLKTSRINIPNINIVDTDDSFTLLMMLLKVLNGESGLTEAVDKMNKSITTYQKSFQDSFVMEYLAEMGGKEDIVVYNQYVEEGFNINIVTFDRYRQLFRDDIEYKKNSLDSFLYSIIRNPNKDVTYATNMVFNYNDTNGNIKVTFPNPDVKMKDMIENVFKKGFKYNTTTIMYDILDDMFNLNNRGENYLKNKYQMEMVINNDIIKTMDDSYYEFTRDDIFFIENKIVLKGDYYYGEPSVDGYFTKDDYENLLTSPNEFNLPVISLVMNLLLTRVDAKYVDIARKNFIEKFLFSYKNVLLRNTILSSEMVLLYNLCFRTDSLNRISLLSKHRDFLRCTSKSFINSILSTLFNMVKKEILKLVGSMAIIYGKEAIAKYRKIIMSLNIF